ncbi:MAG: tryptophan synthase subunit alpha [Candidatus Omnitrophota bacterium]
MNRINKLFSNLKKAKKKALIVYITAGDPDMGVTEKLVHELADNGADLIELGIPFSDPLADGPTIQKASQRSLLRGTNIESILRMVRVLRKSVETPLVFMTYYNLILHYGLKKFVKDSKASGADGIIVPDLPPEEAGDLMGISKEADFSVIFLAAPTSTKSRLKIIAGKSTGFIYYVSLTGVTGTRKTLPSDIVEHVKTLKKITKKPICVGFGISGPDQAKKISKIADGVIVGSAVIKIIEKSSRAVLYKRVGNFVKGLKKAIS